MHEEQAIDRMEIARRARIEYVRRQNRILAVLCGCVAAVLLLIVMIAAARAQGAITLEYRPVERPWSFSGGGSHAATPRHLDLLGVSPRAVGLDGQAATP